MIFKSTDLTSCRALCQVSYLKNIFACLSYLIYPKTNDEKLQDGALNVPTVAKYPLYSEYQSCKILFENICGWFEMEKPLICN